MTGIIASQAFVPNKNPGLQAWYDGKDRATIIESGGGVTNWVDKSRNGNDLTQGTAGFRPTYVLNAFDGLPAVRFDGVNDYLAKLGISPALASSDTLSVFVVQKRISQPADFVGYMSLWETIQNADFNNKPSVAFDNFTVLNPQLQTVRDLGAGDNLINDTPHPTNGIPFVFSSIFDGAGNDSFLNGGVAGFTNPSLSTGNFNIQNIVIGARFNAGAVSFFWNGDLAEIIIYSATLSDLQRSEVEIYLINKWQINVSFPFVFSLDFSSDFS